MCVVMYLIMCMCTGVACVCGGVVAGPLPLDTLASLVDKWVKKNLSTKVSESGVERKPVTVPFDTLVVDSKE